ncbi:MAG: hypothetical protein HYW04_09135 [Deltaproteobacteria bacterium]|nr:hypothetical protein [Deltaproteobacteria bacterium]
MRSNMSAGLFIAGALFLFAAVQPAGAQEKKAKKVKLRETEAVISGVGQRTITYKYERKGKTREEVVGIGEQTYIERISREKINLKDLREGDKVYIRYEDGAYEPALSVQVVGKEELKKKGKKKGD